jgi:hypothetical protein
MAESDLPPPMPSATRTFLRAASLLLLGACASPPLAIRVENATGAPIEWVDCRISNDGGGVGGGAGLAPAEHATFSCGTSEATAVTVDVRWEEGGELEHIELGAVGPPGARVRLLGPGHFELVDG